MIKLIVGLGNPGLQYQATRHNAGFLFLDRLASSGIAGWSASGQFNGEMANLTVKGMRLVLLKPTTFMNKSGMSVGKVLRYHKLRPEEMLVVHDELELPEGRFKLKRDGGHSGHNGLRDIIAHIDSRDFYRLRIGISRPPLGDSVADYVLSRPGVEGEILFDRVCKLLVDHLDLLINCDVAAVERLTI